MNSEKHGYIYIMASAKNGTLYVWVTSNLIGRVWQHKNHVNKKSFTDRYDCDLLVYYEIYETIDAAIEREKQIKWWSRQKKILLIEKDNPEWRDLYGDIA